MPDGQATLWGIFARAHLPLPPPGLAWPGLGSVVVLQFVVSFVMPVTIHFSVKLDEVH